MTGALNGKTKWIFTLVGFLYLGLTTVVGSAHINIDKNYKENIIDHKDIRQEVNAKFETLRLEMKSDLQEAKREILEAIRK